eukprot:PhF_6_TR36518/c0_g1_i1/m.53793
MAARFLLHDGYKAIGKSQKLPGRFSVLDPGVGPYRDVLLQMQRMEAERKAKGVTPSTLCFDDLSLAAELIGFDGKPTYVVEANCLFDEKNTPPDTLQRVVQSKAAFDKKLTQMTEEGDGGEAESSARKRTRSSLTEESDTASSIAAPFSRVDSTDPRIEWMMVQYPAYWKPPFSGHPVRATRLTTFDWQYKMCERMVTSTIADFHKLRYKYSTLCVTNVERVENPTLWSDYFQIRGRIQSRATTTVPHVLTKHLTESSGANEYYFFHGLNANLVEVVINEGFDERVSNLRGMFGCGVYFAENSSKSDQYSHCVDCKQIGAVYKGSVLPPCTCTHGKPKYMLLCRVVLGDPMVQLAATTTSGSGGEEP